MRKILAVFVIIGGIFATMLSPAYAASQDIVSVSASQRTTDSQIILDEINKYRASKGVGPVSYSKTLSDVVQKESDRQVAEERFSHSESFLTDPRVGRYTSANEVIALEYHRDVRALVKWWIGSPAHEAAISNPNHSVIGVGLSYADGNLTYTGQAWQILSTVNLYGYSNGDQPADTTSRVGPVPSSVRPVTSAPITPINPGGFITKGGIGTKYNSAGGISVLGPPVMNERCGLVGNGCYQEFVLNGKKSTIYWSPSTGAKIVKTYAAIGQRFIREGRERGIGFPTTDEVRVGAEVIQRFSSGLVMHWASGRGTWITR